jgi:hypothetical protein
MGPCDTRLHGEPQAQPNYGERRDHERDNPPKRDLLAQAATVDEIVGGGKRQEIGLGIYFARASAPAPE